MTIRNQHNLIDSFNVAMMNIINKYPYDRHEMLQKGQDGQMNPYLTPGKAEKSRYRANMAVAE